MYTYSQLKKIQKKNCEKVNITYHLVSYRYELGFTQGVNGAPNVPKLCASCGMDISKCIEGGSMILATQIDYICM